MVKSLGILVISKNIVRIKRLQNVLESLKYSAIQYNEKNNSLFERLRESAIKYLESGIHKINLQIIHGDTFLQVLEKLIAKKLDQQNNPMTIGMIVIEMHVNIYENQHCLEVEKKFTEYFEKIKNMGINCLHTTFSCVVYSDSINTKPFNYYLAPAFILRKINNDPHMERCDFLHLIMEFLNQIFLNRFVSTLIKNKSQPSIIGREIAGFFINNYGNKWMLSYFTGSPISHFIDSIEKEVLNTEVTIIRGKNEHSLCCSAVANWRLLRLPFLIIITMAMLDEFKGTLINLKSIKARGIIVLPECEENRRFVFQGTISPEEDVRDVLKAKRIPFVYINKIELINVKIQELLKFYWENNGPVVLMMTKEILEIRKDLTTPFSNGLKPVCTAHFINTDENDLLNTVIRIINQKKVKLLWQCDYLQDEERVLLYKVAEESGIGLVDSLVNPGVVSRFYQGNIVANYAGTLGMYGYSQRCYDYLYENKKLLSKDRLSFLFLGGKIEQACTPFSRSDLENKLEIAHVAEHKEHLAYFADYRINLPVNDFLKYVKQNLNVEKSILDYRNYALDKLNTSRVNPISEIKTFPMTLNYFYDQLNNLIEYLINACNYTYTGVFDVGRCAMAGIRYLSRTDPGFSGWLGRAIMGDALQSIPALALTVKNNILAFIGDGAKALVPSIRETLVESLFFAKNGFDKNITVFFMCNGMFAMVRTYYERMFLKSGGRQMRVINYHEPDAMVEVNGCEIYTKTLGTFDQQFLSESLMKKKRINFFSVMLSHNITGDGITFMDESAWQNY